MFEDDETNPFDEVVPVDNVVLVLLLPNKSFFPSLFQGLQSSLSQLFLVVLKNIHSYFRRWNESFLFLSQRECALLVDMKTCESHELGR